jgi:putative ABC transport system permease protein
MDTLVQDLKYGLRTLLKNPGFTTVAVLALALGIGANTAIFSVVNAVLLRPLPYPDPDRLMTVWENNLKLGWHEDVVSPANFLDWRAQNTVFESMAAYSRRGFNLRTGEGAERIRGAVVSADFFKVLRTAPQRGRGFLPEDGGAATGRVALVSHSLWQGKLGGDAQIVGRSITIDSQAATVIGVTPEGFELPEEATIWVLAKNVVPENVWLPASVDITTVRGLHYLPVLARLKPGVTQAAAQAEMDAIAARLAAEHPRTNADYGVEIVPLHRKLVGDVRPALLVFLGAVGLVLLIACANVANMSLARAAARRREVAIRTALGASRGRLLRQYLTESILLAVLGGGAGLLLALWGTDLLIALQPDSIPGVSRAGIDGRVLGFTLGLSILTGLLFGVAPALHAASADPHVALKEGGRTSSVGPRARLLRGGLVVAEMAVALVLLAGSGLLIRSFLHLTHIEPGIRIDGVLTLGLSTPDASYQGGAEQGRFYTEILRRVRTLPGVESAAATTNLPLGGIDTYFGLEIEGRPPAGPGEGPESGMHQVSPDYFRTLGIPILRGRPFLESDVDGAPSVKIISKTMAERYWPGEDAIGKRISYARNPKGEPQWSTVVGVVGDVRQVGLHTEPRPEAYVPFLQRPSRYMTLVLRSTLDPATLAESVRREVRAVDRDVPAYDARTMREVLDGSLATRRFNMALLMVFAAVALALASVGLYGVIAYMVTQRTHEIGVRLALGASQADVLRLVVGHGMGLALGGVALGLVGAFGLTRALSSLLAGVSVTDPWTFAAMVLLLTLVAFLACFVPARRAARLDPMATLRAE